MLRFDKMIAPTFLTILYYIHTLCCMGAGLWFISKGMDAYYGGGMMVIGGIAGLVLGPLLIRLFYELLIVIFKIHSRLSSIDYTLSHTQPNPVPTEPLPDPAHPVASTGASSERNLSAVYAASEQTAAPSPVPDPTPPPIGTHASSPLPESVIPDFWPTVDNSSSARKERPATTPVPAIDLNNLRQKVPNWPAVLAAILVLYAVISPYAVIGYDSSMAPGQLAGLTYAIKNSSLGIVTVFAALTMIVAAAGGLKWLGFTGAYGLTVLGAVVAFLNDNSLFSQLAKARETMNGVSSTLNTIAPGADQFTRHLTGNVPSASQYLTLTFYLFVLAMLFLGYWALAGNYQERGLLTTSTD